MAEEQQQQGHVDEAPELAAGLRAAVARAVTAETAAGEADAARVAAEGRATQLATDLAARDAELLELRSKVRVPTGDGGRLTMDTSGLPAGEKIRIGIENRRRS